MYEIKFLQTMINNILEVLHKIFSYLAENCGYWREKISFVEYRLEKKPYYINEN